MVNKLTLHTNIISFCLLFFILFLFVSSAFASTISNATNNATEIAMNKVKNILTAEITDASNTTEDSMTEAKNIVNLASDAASNATQAAMDQARNILSNVTTSVSDMPTNTTLTLTNPVVKNYSSNLYQILFQYPSSWELSEKTSRFDEGTDISMSSFSPSGFISIQYLNSSTIQDLGLQRAVYEFFKSSIDSDYGKEYKVIEQPSFVTIDKQKAGTYLYTHKDKYEEFATKWASQIWIVYAGNHGYLLSFMTSTNQFDTPEMKQIRDQFLKSIKFLGVTNQTNNNAPNRFD
jgi:hypothetical protein